VKCFQRLRSLLQTAPGSGLRELLRETGCLDYLE
jgi:hypothetical protein